MKYFFLTLAAITLLPTNHILAQVAINSAQPITRRILVNPIRTVKTDGTTATVWGTNRTVEFYIKQQVDRILSQSGVDVQFAPVIDFVSDFAYDGSPIDYTTAVRPQEDLLRIVNLVDIPTFSDREVINCFFVEIVPSFNQQVENATNGLAFVPGNGIAIHFGEDLLEFVAGRDALARTLAHEIAHNLGIAHSANRIENLMSPGGSTGRLTQPQINAILNNTPFAKPLAETTYNGWSNLFSLTEPETGDDDNDGFNNLLEYALGMDPTLDDVTRAPQPMNINNRALILRIDKQESAVEDGVNYQIQVSDDLNAWPQAGALDRNSSTIVDDNNEVAGVTTIRDQTQGFIRLAVTRTPPSTITSVAPINSIVQPSIDSLRSRISACGVGSCGHTIVQEEE